MEIRTSEIARDVGSRAVEDLLDANEICLVGLELEARKLLGRSLPPRLASCSSPSGTHADDILVQACTPPERRPESVRCPVVYQEELQEPESC